MMGLKGRRAFRFKWFLPVVLVVALIAIAVIFTARVYASQERQRENLIESCERINALRERVSMLEALHAPMLPEDFVILAQFPCESL